MSPEGSYKNYRSALHNSNPPCIPYIGTYLSDLTFIDDGNKNTINGLINFSKRQLTYKVISEMQRYQQIGYYLKPVSDIQQILNEIPSFDEKSFSKKLYEISLQKEPRT